MTLPLSTLQTFRRCVKREEAEARRLKMRPRGPRGRLGQLGNVPDEGAAGGGTLIAWGALRGGVGFACCFRCRKRVQSADRLSGVRTPLAFSFQRLLEDGFELTQRSAAAEGFEGEWAALGKVVGEVGFEGLGESGVERREVDLVVQGEGAVIEVG